MSQELGQSKRCTCLVGTSWKVSTCRRLLESSLQHDTEAGLYTEDKGPRWEKGYEAVQQGAVKVTLGDFGDKVRRYTCRNENCWWAYITEPVIHLDKRKWSRLFWSLLGATFNKEGTGQEFQIVVATDWVCCHRAPRTWAAAVDTSPSSGGWYSKIRTPANSVSAEDLPLGS